MVFQAVGPRQRTAGTGGDAGEGRPPDATEPAEPNPIDYDGRFDARGAWCGVHTWVTTQNALTATLDRRARPDMAELSR